MSTSSPTKNTVAQWLNQLHLEELVSEPYYLQLQRQVEFLIRSGALPAGSSLPSERDMAALLGISRVTVKHCYDELRRANLLITKGRRGGTWVQGVPRVSPVLHDLKGFTDEMRELGRAPSACVLERAVVSDRMAASMFGRSSSAEFLRLVRLRLADGIPMSREIAWYDLSLAPPLADWPGEGSTYAFLRLRLTWAKQTIEAAYTSKFDAIGHRTRRSGFKAGRGWSFGEFCGHDVVLCNTNNGSMANW
jgi:GntR family transcriptional regulator